MPGGDGTGPAGMGPMTGRGAGYCAGYTVPGFAKPVGGRYIGTGSGAFSGGGSGARSGRGKGYRHWYNKTGLPGWYRYNAGMPAWGAVPPSPVYPPYADPYTGPEETPVQEKKMLQEQADFLKQQLDSIQERIAEVEKETQKKEK